MSQQAPNTPFRSGWYSFDLGQYRPCNSTYCYYPYEGLPPLPATAHTDSLDWLGPLDEHLDQEMEVHRPPAEQRSDLEQRAQALGEQAQQLGLTLPVTFLPFMASSELQDRIPSCTACTFGLPQQIVKCPGSENGYVIRFLNDQQDVLLWYLYLTPAGDHCVIVAPYEFYELAEEPEQAATYNDEQRKAILDNTFVCSPSFGEFLYRFWLENSIWFALNDGTPLTADQQQYVSHYATAK
jgi:hypothetical protein